MKLLLRQYLSSLNERDELDVVLPDIMSEVGYTVISRPKRGTTQYGVDVAAVGPHPKTGQKSLFLLSIKSGDLTRDEWATGKQALRPSLEEVIEVYIPKHVPTRYKDLPIIIALCFGGDIQEDVRLRVDAFIDKNTTPGRLEFEEWNGDHIANLIATGLLRENIFPNAMQASFRKAVALVDEPSVCVAHFHDLLQQLIHTSPKNLAERLRIARQIYLATWTIFVWCRDAENLEAAYRGSALATLRMWDLCHAHFGRTKLSQALTEVTQKMILLSRIIATTFIEQHVEPYCKTVDGLGVSVPSASSVDINLKLFEILGRVAMSGLWLIHVKAFQVARINPDHESALDNELKKCETLICDMIRQNQVFYTPLRDDHAIEITLVGIFLIQCNAHEFMANWVEQITLSSIFSHRTSGQYPCVFREYADLAMHPKSGEGYREEATVGSVLYPTLGVWLAMLNDNSSFRNLAEFHAKNMKHSTWQLWLPDETSEEHFYVDSAVHGSCIAPLTTSGGPEAFLEQINREIVACTEFGELSAVQYGQWPIALMACQIHRLPIPPHFLTMRLLPGEADVEALDDTSDQGVE
ncbi:hypothetical protein [Mesorhizobium sp. M8A.F.Ca.ET.165.01.1.1]|uniref:hypothetical protein n=1 Tax=Mesorhizobium sp. M8A.F.Ca.ET.165.01.1.1 TaxID=2563960 RepID=UPI001093F147|nr:hypothetical protein [Mesorhizobium sp. M8A.F.Ca.ET.165.01.1.1]TGT40257.1 hypothetical protein EN808_16795 [Mesorhizobium sp. M8A.F.Ca.ET.165.01.1.1]